MSNDVVSPLPSSESDDSEADDSDPEMPELETTSQTQTQIIELAESDVEYDAGWHLFVEKTRFTVFV